MSRNNWSHCCRWRQNAWLWEFSIFLWYSMIEFLSPIEREWSSYHIQAMYGRREVCCCLLKAIRLSYEYVSIDRDMFVWIDSALEQLDWNWIKEELLDVASASFESGMVTMLWRSDMRRLRSFGSFFHNISIEYLKNTCWKQYQKTKVQKKTKNLIFPVAIEISFL